jgi:hypothetical protein
MRSPTSKYKYSKPKLKSSYLLLAILIILLVLLGVLALNKRNILDWFRLHNYNPPAAVMRLASEDTMTPYAKKIFKVNHPDIENKKVFNTNCPNDGGEKTIVLGCYHSNQEGIYLLSVTDSRLEGVEQVTAAHEMLHAAYDRLSSSERSKVDVMLLNYYNHDLHNDRIRADLALYKQTEPHEVVNEMHSIFGTEIANLPPGLEQYYKRYFSDRERIASYANQYEAVFTSRQTEVTQDDTELTGIKTQIESMETNVESKYSAIGSQAASLRAEKISNTAAYNAAVPEYNDQVTAYQSELVQLQSLITGYNTLVTQRNNVALIENQLYQELSGAKS